MADETKPRCLVKHKDLTAAFVRAILDYDAASGVFTWRWRADCALSRNRRRTGKTAGYIRQGRYWIIRIDGRDYVGGQLAWIWITGQWPPDEVDHRDRDGTNNRWINLRAATSAQNQQNQGIQKNNQSGRLGVYWATGGITWGRWRAVIKHDGVQYHLGYFDTVQAAGDAYDAAALRLRGDFAASIHSEERLSDSALPAIAD